MKIGGHDGDYSLLFDDFRADTKAARVFHNGIIFIIGKLLNGEILCAHVTNCQFDTNIHGGGCENSRGGTAIIADKDFHLVFLLHLIPYYNTP